MEDKIPGLEKSLSARRALRKGVYIHDTEDTAVDQPCTDAGERLAANTRKQKKISPQDPDRPSRPHSDLGPSEGEDEDNRNEA